MRHTLCMQSKTPVHLKVGDELDGTVLKSNGGRRFSIKCPAVGRQWDIELHTRRPELIQEGDHVHVWIAKIAVHQAEMLVHEGDYGRLPVSESMRPRYIAAMQAVLGEGEATAEALADARTMVMQMTKQQSADWLTIWRILGEPRPSDAKALIAAIDAMRTARKEDPDAIAGFQTAFAEQFGEPFHRALTKLQEMA